MRTRYAIARLGAGVLLAVVGLAMVADEFGVVPDAREQMEQTRAETLEDINLGAHDLLHHDQAGLINGLLRRMVNRHPDVVGAAIKNSDGEIIFELGHINPAATGGADGAVLPIDTNAGRWGTIGIAFRAAPLASLQQHLRNPLVRLTVAVALTGLFAYELYRRRRPSGSAASAVMPDRMRPIMDALAEGVVLLDDKCRIVMGNTAFAEAVDIDIEGLPGRSLSSFSWSQPSDGEAISMPWEIVVELGLARRNVLITLTNQGRGHRFFSLNVSPIWGAGNVVTGALATFDDQTEIVQKNNELRKALQKLSTQQTEIETQNAELRRLATRDPLTACLNRRAFIDIFEKEFLAARNRFKPLSCIMCDIDHFKRVNDTFGHSVGDRVIQQMAECIGDAVRENDHVCRYGGEEFCVVLPGLDAAGAAQVAERIRQSIEGQSAKKLRLTGGRTITASFGVTDLNAKAQDLAELIDQADGALYVAKAAGRNRVSIYGNDHHRGGTPEENQESA